MRSRKWFPNIVKRLFGFEDRLNKQPNLRGYYRPQLETMEERLAPAVSAVQVGGLLTVLLSAPSDHAFLSNTGANITVDNATAGGSTIGTFTGVTAIQVQDTAAFANQQATFSLGTAFTQSVTLTGIETANLAQNIIGTVSGNATVANVAVAGQIQDGVNIVASGATVNVATGTYLESNILVPRPMSIIGQSRTGVIVAPAFEDAHIDSTFGGAFSHGFIVDSSNVTIMSMTIDGEGNGALTPGRNNYGVGITTDGIFNNLRVENVSIQDVYRRGIQIFDVGTGHVITGNSIDGVELVGNGYAIITFGGDATITNNVITNATGGIAANFADTIGGTGTPLLTVQGNSITGADIGMNLNGLDNGSLIGGPLLANRNTISLAGGGADIGMTVAFVRGLVTVQNNLITGDGADAALWLYNNTAAFPPVLVTGNTLTATGSTSASAGQGTGIFLTDDQTITSDAFDASFATITGNTITGFVRGIDLFRNGTLVPGGFTVQATIGGATAADSNTISGSAVGIRVFDADGPLNGYRAVADILGNAALTGNTTAIQVDGGTANVIQNTINANVTGVRVTNGGLLSASQNFITGNSGDGIAVATGLTAGLVGSITNNDLSGNAGLGVNNTTGAAVNASANWWGSNTAAAVAAEVSANVDYTPWLNFGADTAAAAGFQGDFSSLHVDDNSPQTGATARIAEAIGLLADGSLLGGARIVQVEEGTYTENVTTATKALTLALGAGPAQVTLNGNLTLDANDTLAVDIAGYIEGSNYDQLVVNGIVNLGNATLVVNDTLSNANYIPGFPFEIIENDAVDAVIGTFSNPSTIVANGHTYEIFYNYGTAPGNGNDVVLRLAASPVYTDDFNRPDSATLGSNWTNQAGAFSISGQTAVATSVDAATQSALATLNGVSLADSIIQANVTLSASAAAHAGLVARYSGPGVANMYWAGLIRSSGTIYAQIYRNLGGTWTLLSSTVVNIPSALLRFEVLNDSLKLFINNEVRVWAFDTSITSAGLVGMWSSLGGTFDNFSVDEHAPLVNVTLPFSDNFTQPNGSELSSKLAERLGNYSVQANALVGNDAANVAVLNGVVAADVFAEATVALTGVVGSYAGVSARYSGTGLGNMYWGGLIRTSTGVTANIYAFVNGNATLISSQNVGLSTGVVRLEVSGQSLRLFLNGGLVGSGIHSGLTSGSLGVLSSQGAVVDTFSANNIPFTNATLPFSDNFNTMSNGQQMSSSWNNKAGNFTGQNQAVVAGPGGNLAVLNGVNATDVDVQAFVTVAPGIGTFAGMAGRTSGTGLGNLYWGGFIRTNTGNTINIYRFVNGAGTLLYTANISASSGVMRLHIVGDSIQLYLNGTLVAAANDSTLTSGSGGILASEGGTFDDFFMAAVTTSSVTIPPQFNDSLAVPIGASLSENWQNRAGAYIGTGTSVRGFDGGNFATLRLTSNLTNTSLQANVNLAAGDAFFGLMTRVTGPGLTNGYWGGLQRIGNQVFARVYRFVNGAATLIGSTAVSAGFGTINFDVSGSSLVLSVNGNPTVTVFDAVLTTAGTVGISASKGTVVSNFSANGA